MSNRIELTGKRFGKLTVLRYAGCRKWGCYWSVKCDCGTEKEVDGKALRHGKVVSCRCRLKEFNKDNRLRPYENLYHLFVRAAGRTTYVVNLPYDEFLVFTKETQCHYCGFAVHFQEYSAKGATYNLDRKDNTLGYSKDNCVVCCKTCNFAKGARYTYGEWLAMTTALRLYRKSLEGTVATT
jgi:hypothetical protein